MAKLAYKDVLRDDEIELFIRTYCSVHAGWSLERGKSPEDPLWPEYCWWLNTRDRGCMAALDLKSILEEILKVDRRVFHTWKSPEGMRMWFDLNKIAKDKQSCYNVCVNQLLRRNKMPTIAQICDLQGQMLYSNYGQSISYRRCKAWYVADHYVTSSMADQFYVKKCSSRQAAVNWATSKRRIKEYGENAKFYITHA